MTDEHFDAVVVGSGFGGSTMAHSLADAGLSVCLLERGKAFRPGDFPRSPHGMKDNFWDPSEGKHGMFDVWTFSGMDVLQSSGLGGGSLIYANVLIRKDETWFVRDRDEGGYEHWPVTRADLDPHYDAVERLIGVEAYPPHLRAITPKSRVYSEAARQAGLDHRWLPLAVTFSKPGQVPGEPAAPGDVPPNRYGMTRGTCRLCGECDIGCNYGAKNTLDLTLISAAERLGCQVRTRAEVRSFRRMEDRWRVEYVTHAEERQGKKTDTWDLPRQIVTGRSLIISAGALGSTYLLMRNRENLPGLSPSLGKRFSGNGDFLGLLLEALDERGQPRLVDPGRGPVITGGVRVPDLADGGTGRGFYVEDAGYPEFASWLIEFAMTATPSGFTRVLGFAWEVLRQRLRFGRDRNFSAEVAQLFGECRVTKSSLPVLGMGRDVPDGEMALDDEQKYLELTWKNGKSEEFFSRMELTMKALAEAMGARYRPSPLFSLEKRLITVHPLGGCGMGRHPEEGVVDAWGEVFGHPGLFVADGAVMPGPVGPNPSLTIAALSRRFSERVIDRVKESWRTNP